MIEFLHANFVPVLFAGLLCFLMLGFPVAFSLAATGLAFGVLGIEIGLFPEVLFQALPLRVIGIMSNETLLAIPFFTLMGIILERSRMAEELLETVAQVFGPVRGGLAVAVILVGALLAATTGVVAAAVISMGLISLPIMLRYGYNRTIATGTITASGTLAQALPPSLVLIVLADQLGRSVGDMYQGALLPGLMLVGLYLLFILFIALVRPKWVPALPEEARIYVEPNGNSGHKSLLVLFLVCGAVGVFWYGVHESIMNPLLGRETPAPGDERFIMSTTVATFVALFLAILNRVFKLGLISRLTEQVTFVLIPPLILIFLVLGTIFLGVATPTEGGAM
ncbi:MAG TPA: TRAP transporter large permease subunit, partial [Hydrogenophaga sp.]